VDILGGDDQRAELLIERFESAVTSLVDADAEILLDVFGLSPETADIRVLAKRRDYYGAKHGIGREAVADRDQAAIERLLEQLISGWYPKSPMPIRVPEAHNGAVIYSIRTRTLVSDHRHIETHYHFRLFPLFDGAEYFAIATENPVRPKVVGTGFRLETVEVDNGYIDQFWCTEPMQRGNTYELHYIIKNPDPVEPYWLYEESMAFHEPTRYATFEIKFIKAVPRVVWKVDRLTAVERPGRPVRSNLLKLSESGVAIVQYRDLYGGLINGIAWDW